jgi:hypothetical protein
MISTITRPVFVHSIVNPPGEDRSSDADLEITRPKGKIVLTKGEVSLQTQYSLTVLEPASLGPKSAGQAQIENFVRDLVLAADLGLLQAAISTLQGNSSPSQVEFKPPETKVTVEQTPNGGNVHITEFVTMRDTVHIQIGFREQVDESGLLDTLGLVLKADRHSEVGKMDARQINLKKALDEYENAMSSFDRVAIFKHLFNSLELATNSDSKGRSGSDLDGEVSRVTGVSISDVASWRRFYDRLKHIDRTPKDITEFVSGMSSIPEHIRQLRPVASKMLLDRLV